MKLEDLQKIDLFQTRTIAEACQRKPEIHAYIMQCLARFFRGDYGAIGPEDTAYNNADLEAGEGHVLARYKARPGMEEDIYIEAHFSEEVPGIDANNIMIMYCSER